VTPEERAWAEASIASRSREAKRTRMRLEVQQILACRDRLYPENDAVLTRELQIPRTTVVATRLVLEQSMRLGREKDAALADELKVSKTHVLLVREALKIAARKDDIEDTLSLQRGRVIAHQELLGTRPDFVIAEELYVPTLMVSEVRRSLGIHHFVPHEIIEKSKADRRKVIVNQALLGTKPDVVIAGELQVSVSTVATVRRALGIGACFRGETQHPGRDRVMAHCDRLGRVPDHVLALDIGVSTTLVCQVRRGLNIPSFAERAEQVVGRRHDESVHYKAHKTEREGVLDKENERLRSLMEDLAARRRERETVAAEALLRKVEEKRAARDAKARAARNRWRRVKKHHSSSVTTADLNTVEVWSGDLQWPEEELLDWEPDMAWELGLKVCTMWRVVGRVMSADSLGAYRLCEEAVLFDRKPKVDRSTIRSEDS